MTSPLATALLGLQRDAGNGAVREAVRAWSNDIARRGTHARHIQGPSWSGDRARIDIQRAPAVEVPPLTYDPHRPLTWDDFEAKAPDTGPRARYSALADVKITEARLGVAAYAAQVADAEEPWTAKAAPLAGEHTVEAQFHRATSFRRRGHETPLLLDHEQGHFDIAHVMAQRILAALDEESDRAEVVYRGGTTREEALEAAIEAASAPLRSIYQKGVRVWQYADSRYDGKSPVGTDNGQRPKQQRWWRRWITMGLPTFKLDMRLPEGSPP